MFTKLLQGTLEKELPTQLQPEEKLREINTELEHRIAERSVGLENANAELRHHVAEGGADEDQLKTSLGEIVDVKAALDEHAIVARTNPQGNPRRMISSSPEPPHWQGSQTFALIAAMSVALLGIVVLTGWLLHIEALRCILPGSAPLKPNIAMGFLLCGAALILLSAKTFVNPIRICAGASLIVAALGALTLIEYFFNWNLGIDHWLVRDFPTSMGPVNPGRMMPTTALCFALMGTALFAEAGLLPRRFRFPLVAGISAMLVLIGVLALGGFLLEALFGPRWNLLGMSLSGVTAAVGFMILGSGLLALLQSKGGLIWSLNAVTTAGFAIGILLTVLTTASAFTLAKQMLQTNNWVTHRQEVLKEVQQCMTGLAELASSERVYTIVGNEGLLKEREQTSAAVKKDIVDIRKLTADNPNQRARLARLEPLIAERFEWEEKVIVTRRQQGSNVAGQMIAAGPGLRLSEEILGLLKKMQNEEYDLLGVDRKRAEAASIATFLLLPLGVFVSLAVLSLAVFFLNAGAAERAESEKALRQSEERMRAVLESALDCVIAMDHQGRIVEYNPAAEKTFGYRREQAIGQLLSDLIIPPALRERHQKGLSRYLATGEAPVLGQRLELTAMRSNGAEFPVEVAITRIGSQEPPMFTGFIRDITERKQGENALRTSEAQLHTIVENLDEGVVVSDLNGRLLHWNRAALKLHGYADSDQDRRRFTELIDTFELSTLDGALVSVEEWPLARILRGEKVQDLELRVRRIGCDWQRIFHYGGTLVHDATNQPLMAIVTVGDITERKLAEEEILRLNAELEQRVGQRTAELEAANKELEAFSYSVSHDLRAPLRHVAGFVELLREDAAPRLSEKSVRYLTTISQSAKRMGDLIDDLLAFSRAGRSEMQKDDVNLDELVRQTLSEFQVSTKGREITWDVSPLPTVRADRSMLRQVLVNLISNAVKFTSHRAEAKIDIGCAPNGNGESVIFIRDNGAGFDPKYTGKLFGVFQRLHRQDQFEGTGIGLANVERIIRRHGGRVWAEAEVNKGATFYFTVGGSHPAAAEVAEDPLCRGGQEYASAH